MSPAHLFLCFPVLEELMNLWQWRFYEKKAITVKE